MTYTVQHTGYPVAGRPIEEREWKLLSTHKTLSAACKRINKEKSHLSYGSWDDHYRVIDPDGKVEHYAFEKWHEQRLNKEFKNQIGK